MLSLGDFYVYGLIDPRTYQVFYVGKWSGNRVFDHKKESLSNPESAKLKLKTISEIHAAETALINAFNYVSDAELTNIAAGRHSLEALSVEEYEKLFGTEELKEEDIRHRILIIKINKLYHKGISENELYDSVRRDWKASIANVQQVEYVFGVYRSLIVAVYKPTRWYKCKDALDKRPRPYEDITAVAGRIFFVDEDFENGKTADSNETFYCGKSIGGLKINQGAQNPITYLKPKVDLV